MQPGRRTVQDELQKALATVLRVASVALAVAGRTDAGVHATGQVAHFDATAIPSLRWLNAALPDDLVVRRVTPVPAEFDARFGALWRRYEYRISDDPAGVSPLRRRFVLDHRRALDVTAMGAAASLLFGLRDFAAFCKWRDTGTTVRTVERFDVQRVDDEIVATIQADAFCHSMVRSIIGALLAVGEGRRAPDWPASLLTATTRSSEVTVAAPHGLTLVEVGYPPDGQLAERLQTTRAKRPTLG